MARPRDPTALKNLRGKKHMTKDEKAAVGREVYAAKGDIAPPECIAGNKEMAALFEKHAAYMRRVNKAAGVAVYGDTDAEALAQMVMAHFRYLDYRHREGYAEDIKARASYNLMKNREAATYERLLKALKLDPGSRVDLGAARGDGDDGDEF